MSWFKKKKKNNAETQRPVNVPNFDMPELSKPSIPLKSITNNYYIGYADGKTIMTMGHNDQRLALTMGKNEVRRLIRLLEASLDEEQYESTPYTDAPDANQSTG